MLTINVLPDEEHDNHNRITAVLVDLSRITSAGVFRGVLRESVCVCVCIVPTSWWSIEQYSAAWCQSKFFEYLWMC